VYLVGTCRSRRRDLPSDVSFGCRKDPADAEKQKKKKRKTVSVITKLCE
jgi:hypothetical protein